ncbi:hypothetical protein LP419_29230 [Massilia sp. H-1]|nr:hypothetical protein LP419_29230 [Massilia sp. H-1]
MNQWRASRLLSRKIEQTARLVKIDAAVGAHRAIARLQPEWQIAPVVDTHPGVIDGVAEQQRGHCGLMLGSQVAPATQI